MTVISKKINKILAKAYSTILTLIIDELLKRHTNIDREELETFLKEKNEIIQS